MNEAEGPLRDTWGASENERDSVVEDLAGEALKLGVSGWVRFYFFCCGVSAWGGSSSQRSRTALEKT